MAVKLSHASPVFFSSSSALDLKVVCVEADWKVTVCCLSIICSPNVKQNCTHSKSCCSSPAAGRGQLNASAGSQAGLGLVGVELLQK